jgi:hypothetical protein
MKFDQTDDEIPEKFLETATHVFKLDIDGKPIVARADGSRVTILKSHGKI